MSEGLYYADLSPVARITADLFLNRKFEEHMTNNAISTLDYVLRNANFEPWEIMFDATDIGNIKIHATGMFTKIPHQVAYAAANLRTPKYLIVSNNRACIACIAATAEMRVKVSTAAMYLQEHFDDLCAKAAKLIKAKMTLLIPGLRDEDIYRREWAQFVEDSAYEFDDAGNCLEE